MTLEIQVRTPEAAAPPEINPADITLRNFNLISSLEHPVTGFFPAVDTFTAKNPEMDDMDKAWTRDHAMDMVGVVDASSNLRRLGLGSELTSRMDNFIFGNLGKVLDFYDQPRWRDKFKQVVIDRGGFTELSGVAPEIHTALDGEKSHFKRDDGSEGWNQNQPDSWGALLIAVGRAKEEGVVPGFSEKEKAFVRTMAEYLIRIDATRFKSSSMWEGEEGHSPSSRSTALIIAKGLDASRSIFEDDEFFLRRIDKNVEKIMSFIKDDINTDYTAPSGHPDGADLAMVVAMTLPASERTRLPFARYVRENGEKLGIGELPGAIRFIGDPYKHGEMGEARWFMADPLLAKG
jgi:hypothetical protein